MSRVEAAFRRAAGENRAAFVAYLTAGDPAPKRTPALVAALQGAGADVIELGVPFSDPLADGPVNQRAAERALAAGTTLSTVLDIVAEVRRHSQVPIVLFSYFNPIHRMGLEAFAERARAAGVDGVLLTDLAAEDAGAYLPPLRAAGIDTVFLLAPTTSADRIATVASESRGFVYYVSRTGVTGDSRELSAGLQGEVAAVRAHTALPVAVGFGIATAAQVATTAAIADGVVVGSALVRQIEQHAADPDLADRLGSFAAELVAATRR